MLLWPVLFLAAVVAGVVVTMLLLWRWIRRRHRRRKRKQSAREGDSTPASEPPPEFETITLPPGVLGGQLFPVQVCGQQFLVQAPANAQPGGTVKLRIPDFCRTVVPPDHATANPNQMAAPVSSKLIRKINESTYQLRIPSGVAPGQQFSVILPDGRLVIVHVPSGVKSGQRVRITVSPQDTMMWTNTPQGQEAGNNNNDGPIRLIRKVPLWEVAIPKDLPHMMVMSAGKKRATTLPNNSLKNKMVVMVAGGVRVMIDLPERRENTTTTQRVRFEFPVRSNGLECSEVCRVRHCYDRSGWMRVVTASEPYHFQWVRMDEKCRVSMVGSDDGNQDDFCPLKSAFVVRPGDDDDVLRWIPAHEAVTKAKADDDDSIPLADLIKAQVMPLRDKVQWFRDAVAKLAASQPDEIVRIEVRRESLVSDSLEAIMSLTARDLKKNKLWNIDSVGEAGTDASPTSEWFRQVTKELSDLTGGLWQKNGGGKCLQINPASEMACDHHLLCFRMYGRILGKALCQGDSVEGHLSQYLYKYLLGSPLKFPDLEVVDAREYGRLDKLWDAIKNNGEDASSFGLTFCISQGGTNDDENSNTVVELVPGGETVKVTNENFAEYFQACFQYFLFDQFKPQLTELLLGFMEVVPEALSTVFDYQELEMILCDFSEVDMLDWVENTEYAGLFEGTDGDHPVCRWFWEIVEAFDAEMTSRLLHFFRGNCAPEHEFGALRGMDGNIHKFTLCGVNHKENPYPRAHLSSNRIDLPLYESKGELRGMLKVAIIMAATDFDLPVEATRRLKNIRRNTNSQ